MTNPEKTWDVVVIGGGPAGLSTAVWCSDLGMRCVLVEREDDIGGQLWTIHNRIDNYLGIHAENGEQMLEHFRASIDERNFVRQLGAEVSALDPLSKTVRLTNGNSLSAKCIVIATGVRRRTLGIPGETKYKASGIIESGARDQAKLRGKRVLIIGGGDAAMENAIIVAKAAASVKVAFRRSAPSARGEFVASVGKFANVELLPSTVVAEIGGGDRVDHATLRDVGSGKERKEPFDGVLIRIGVEPNTGFLNGVVDLDEQGYVKVTPLAETSVSGIFAVGDVANRVAPTLGSAVGSGATAAKAALEYIG